MNSSSGRLLQRERRSGESCGDLPQSFSAALPGRRRTRGRRHPPESRGQARRGPAQTHRPRVTHGGPRDRSRTVRRGAQQPDPVLSGKECSERPAFKQNERKTSRGEALNAAEESRS
ncbi:hypothetical protein Q5P01_018663 [Channa striata]|uniref:Uncharacterized protein n=1 Tax=Channa striata TaxID=64152 RepID=A0AA88M672_CHASR|nr:hypothetical protein Q5P01_018663 [Channa striata]